MVKFSLPPSTDGASAPPEVVAVVGVAAGAAALIPGAGFAFVAAGAAASVALALRAASPARALRRYGTCVLIGALVAFSARLGVDHRSLVGIFESFGKVLGCGAALMLIGAPLLVLVQRVRRRPSREALDRVMALAGAWLAILGAARIAVLAVAPGVVGEGVAWRPDLAQFHALLLAFVGAAVVAWSAARIGERRAWVARVRAGQVPGYRVEPLGPMVRVPDDVPILRADGEGEYEAIVALEGPTDQGPYRGASTATGRLVGVIDR